MPSSFQQIFRRVTLRPTGDDPLLLLTSPPVNETRQERRTRLALEGEARRVSDEIDVQLREARKRTSYPKVLVLGKSGSGRTTVLKNLRRDRAPEQWDQERKAWRPVILLNLVRNANLVLECLAQELSGKSKDLLCDASSFSQASLGTTSQSTTNFHSGLLARLGCLDPMQRDLEMFIASANLEGYRTEINFQHGGGFQPQRPSQDVLQGHDLFDGWSLALRKLEMEWDHYITTHRDPAEHLEYLKADIESLWGDDLVAGLIIRGCIQLECSAEYFMSNVGRIASKTYQPTDEDILRSWLRTMSPQEQTYAPGLGGFCDSGRNT